MYEHAYAQLYSCVEVALRKWLQSLCSPVSWPKQNEVMQHLAMVSNKLFLFYFPHILILSNSVWSLLKKKEEEDLLQQMLPKNKHSGKQMYLSCCSCRVRISHGGFQSRFPIENRMVSFFHVASMTSSYSVLSPQAKEEESEAILATARKVSQQHFLHLRSQKRLSWGEFSERDHMLYKLQINIFQKFMKSIN